MTKLRADNSTFAMAARMITDTKTDFATSSFSEIACRTSRRRIVVAGTIVHFNRDSNNALFARKQKGRHCDSDLCKSLLQMNFGKIQRC